MVVGNLTECMIMFAVELTGVASDDFTSKQRVVNEYKQSVSQYDIYEDASAVKVTMVGKDESIITEKHATVIDDEGDMPNVGLWSAPHDALTIDSGGSTPHGKWSEPASIKS